MSSKSIRACGLSILAMAALSGALFFGTVGTATADPAVVIKNDGVCVMPGSDANGNMIIGGLGQVETVVINGNKSLLKCKGTGITNLSGRGQSYRDFLCGTFSGLTDDSHAAVSASGVSTLTCTVTLP